MQRKLFLGLLCMSLMLGTLVGCGTKAENTANEQNNTVTNTASSTLNTTNIKENDTNKTSNKEYQLNEWVDISKALKDNEKFKSLQIKITEIKRNQNDFAKNHLLSKTTITDVGKKILEDRLKSDEFIVVKYEINANELKEETNASILVVMDAYDMSKKKYTDSWSYSDKRIRTDNLHGEYIMSIPKGTDYLIGVASTYDKEVFYFKGK